MFLMTSFDCQELCSLNEVMMGLLKEVILLLFIIIMVIDLRVLLLLYGHFLILMNGDIPSFISMIMCSHQEMYIIQGFIFILDLMHFGRTFLLVLLSM